MVTRARSRIYVLVTGACGVVAACGGAVEPVGDSLASGAAAGTGDTAAHRESSAPREDHAPTSGGGECSVGVNCQVFEPGGPERWGCHTFGTEPELACEHAAGAAIARCNCSGGFGERDPSTPDPSPEGGAPAVEWFDIPATSTPFSNATVIQLWNDHCAGRCVSPPPQAPVTDGG